MDNNGLGAVVFTTDVVHGHILVQVIDIWVSSGLAILSARTIEVDRSFLPTFEALFLRKTVREDLVVPFEEITVCKRCQSCTEKGARTQQREEVLGGIVAINTCDSTAH